MRACGHTDIHKKKWQYITAHLLLRTTKAAPASAPEMMYWALSSSSSTATDVQIQIKFNLKSQELKKRHASESKQTPACHVVQWWLEDISRKAARLAG